MLSATTARRIEARRKSQVMPGRRTVLPPRTGVGIRALLGSVGGRRKRMAIRAHSRLRPFGAVRLRRFTSAVDAPRDPRSSMGSVRDVRRVLVIADSLAFHGPRQPELLTHSALYPNVLARELGAEVDVVARLGWTARDAWWALTRDPAVYSVLLPRADAVVLGVGGMDQLPASLPTYLREGISYLRPGWVRRPVRSAFHHIHPY